MDHRSFKEMLEDLIEEAEGAPQAEWQPTAALDYLVVADELLSGRIAVSNDEALSGYHAHPVQSDPAEDEGARTRAYLALPVDDSSVSRELGLDGAGADTCAAARRRFALNNHPDRLPPHLREHAMARMQVANRLIDSAIRAAGGR